MRSLAGGYKLRVLLAQALFGKPQGLLLDEPTNNLDIDSIRWLERFLHDYEGVLVTISHDRHFLNAICTHIADIDYETIITYTGGYDDMVRQKGQVRNRGSSRRTPRRRRRSPSSRTSWPASTPAPAPPRCRAASGPDPEAQARRPEALQHRRPLHQVRGEVPERQTQTLESATSQKRYGGNEVIQPFTALVTRGEKIAVIGKNGVGKTTLVKLLVGDLEPDGGAVKWGHQAVPGYLPQDHAGLIRPGTTAFGWLRELEDKLTNEEISGLLGRMLFSGEERMKPTATLSGGETVRLLLSKLMLHQGQRAGPRRAHQPPRPRRPSPRSPRGCSATRARPSSSPTTSS